MQTPRYSLVLLGVIAIGGAGIAQQGCGAGTCRQAIRAEEPATSVQRLQQEFSIYLVDSSRINVAGVTPDNVGYLTRSIAQVL